VYITCPHLGGGDISYKFAINFGALKPDYSPLGLPLSLLCPDLSVRKSITCHPSVKVVVEGEVKTLVTILVRMELVELIPLHPLPAASWSIAGLRAPEVFLPHMAVHSPLSCDHYEVTTCLCLRH